jgi:hypothetical protein
MILLTVSLGRLRQLVAHWPVVFLGTRGQQSLLACHCCLRAHKSRFYPSISALCECGEPETVQHFHYERFVSQRSVMFAAVRSGVHHCALFIGRELFDVKQFASFLWAHCVKILGLVLRLCTFVQPSTFGSIRFSCCVALKSLSGK